jgi:hypothetical protein
MGVGGTVEYIGPPEQWPNRNKDFSATDNIKEESKDQPKGIKPKSPTAIGGPMMAMAAVKALATPEDTKETAKRQSGDWGVWLYYGKTIGLFPILLAVFFVCAATFTSNFPSKNFHCRPRPRTNNEFCRTLVAMEHRYIDTTSPAIRRYILSRLSIESWSARRNALVSLFSNRTSQCLL